MNTDEIKYFTLTSPSKLDKLIIPVTIEIGDNVLSLNGLWDTGANVSCISHDIVKMFKLPASGSKVLHSAQGMHRVSLYEASIVLPNNVRVENIVLGEVNIASQGIDMLIGMDVIMLGRTTISYKDGISSFTFMIPSPGHSDFFLEQSQ